MKLSVDQALRKARGLVQAGDIAAAEQLYREILGKFPGNRKVAAALEALSAPARGHPPQGDLDALVSLYRERRSADALVGATRLLDHYPHSEILHNLAGAFANAHGRLDAAIAHFDQAIALAPDFADAFNNRGNALIAQKRFAEALADFDRAIGLQRDNADAHVNRAVALAKLRRSDAALAGFATAIRIDPARAGTYNNRGNLFLAEHRLVEALADYDKAIRLRPNYAEAHVNRGNVLKMLKREEEAVASYDAAIALAPSLAKAHNNRGTALRALKRFDEALASHEQALRLNPAFARAYGEVLNLRARICLWPDEKRDDALLDSAIEGDPISPFYMLHLTDDPERQLKMAQAWAGQHFGGIRAAPFEPRASGGKIRLGYFSADFHNHATMYLMARLFELHDRTAFEIYAFSYGEMARDEMRTRLTNAVDAFHDVREQDDAAIAALARTHGIDIAVDLKGYTEGGRPGVFAHRAAPIQVSYLGYPGTLGADFMDYVLADRITVPDVARPYYSEKVVQLPDSYQVNDATRAIASETIARADVGLPERGFVFCCFNNNYKITSAEFAVWMGLLADLDGSVLWLLRDNDLAAANLRREARKRGIDPARLVFADRAPLAFHLARHRCADLFLDTFHYNAHTTASDALWAGLPVVTKLGTGFPARVGGSLLHALGLRELVTESVEDYATLARDLARDPTRLAAIRQALMDNRMAQPLFDTARFTDNLEAVYRQLVVRHEAVASA